MRRECDCIRSSENVVREKHLYKISVVNLFLLSFLIMTGKRMQLLNVKQKTVLSHMFVLAMRQHH